MAVTLKDSPRIERRISSPHYDGPQECLKRCIRISGEPRDVCDAVVFLRRQGFLASEVRAPVGFFTQNVLFEAKPPSKGGMRNVYANQPPPPQNPAAARWRGHGGPAGFRRQATLPRAPRPAFHPAMPARGTEIPGGTHRRGESCQPQPVSVQGAPPDLLAAAT